MANEKGNGVRLYKVQELDKDGKHERFRLVKGRSQAGVIRFCAGPRFEAGSRERNRHGALMAAGAVLEDATGQAE